MSKLIEITRYLLATFLLVTSTFFAELAQAAPQYRGMTVHTGISDEDITALKAYGANIIQYQLTNPNSATDSVEQYMSWLDGVLPDLDRTIALAASLNMKVIINLHSPPGGYSSTDTFPVMRIFSEAAFQTAIGTAWTTIATRYKDDQTTVIGYQILSEPAPPKVIQSGLKDLPKLADSLIKTIRLVDPSRMILVQPAYGDPGRMFTSRVTRDKNVRYAINFYYPISYVQQGIYYPYGKSYPTKRTGKTQLAKNMKKYLKFLKKYRVKGYIGEFSVARDAKGAARYLNDLISIFEKNNLIWTYHAWREATVWSLEHSSTHGDDSLATSVTDRGKVIQKYFSKNR